MVFSLVIIKITVSLVVHGCLEEVGIETVAVMSAALMVIVVVYKNVLDFGCGGIVLK